jgi:hypothetical protein
MDRTNKIVIAITAFIVLLVGSLVYVEVSTTTTEEFYATVTDKSFVPSDSGYHTVIRPDGKGTQMQYWSRSEEWILLFNHNGNVFTDEVGKEFWVAVKDGDEIIVAVPTSYFGVGNPYVVSVTDR